MLTVKPGADGMDCTEVATDEPEMRLNEMPLETAGTPGVTVEEPGATGRAELSMGADDAP